MGFNEKAISECDSLYILPPDISINISNYLNQEFRDSLTERDLGQRITLNLHSLLSEKYSLGKSEYSMRNYGVTHQLDSLININSTTIPDTLMSFMKDINYRYFLLWVSDAEKDDLNLFINDFEIIDFSINNYLVILDKKKGQILRIKSQKKKYDFNQSESVYLSIMKLIKPVYYKKVLGCD